ncbi:MAG: trypsin-like peptidase domain-containing protein [Planctomycetaceae bacterium]
MSLITSTMVGLLLLADPQASATPETSPASRYQLLEFTATWCGPCQEMSGLIHRMQRQGYPIRQIDVEKRRDVANRFKVNSMPTFILLADGKEVTRFVGKQSEQDLLALFQQMAKKYPTEKVETDIVDLKSQPDANVPVETPKPKKSFFNVPFLTKKDEPQDALTNEELEIRGNNDSLDPAEQAEDRADAVPVEIASDPIGASVRLRIKDAKGLNLGSGTVIFSEAGRTIILTCGHIFRNLEEGSRIEVDLFVDGEVRSYLGEALKYNLEADVGLISIETEAELKAALLHDPAVNIEVGHEVFSIGCGGGEKPTLQKLSVTALNRYLGPDNVECTGVPVQGRSGGGLFNAEGKLVGVCIAADPKEQRGLYAGLKPVFDILIEAQLIADPLQTKATESRELVTTSQETLTGDHDASAEIKALAASTATMQQTQLEIPADADAAAMIEAQLGSLAEGNPLEGAEVVCIIRPVKESRAASRVVIIHRASPKFVNYLTEELTEQPRPTSARVSFGESKATASAGAPHVTALSATQTRDTATTSQYKRYRRSAR